MSDGACVPGCSFSATLGVVLSASVVAVSVFFAQPAASIVAPTAAAVAQLFQFRILIPPQRSLPRATVARGAVPCRSKLCAGMHVAPFGPWTTRCGIAMRLFGGEMNRDVLAGNWKQLRG